MKIFLFVVLSLIFVQAFTQSNWDAEVTQELPAVLKEHRKFVSLPNVPAIEADIMKNVAYAQKSFEDRGFKVKLLESESLPVFFAEKLTNTSTKTILFYFHLDGQPADASNWDQKDPFTPVLKMQDAEGSWTAIDWSRLDDDEIDPEWRIFGRAAADDKGPIMMMWTALDLLSRAKIDLKYNVKIILDLQEESSSHGFLSTLEKYQGIYAADYMIIMDGPAHNTNRPTLTFGCRGIATCDITVYGAKLPQHSGHYGNYAPNPIFRMSHLLASMKNEGGLVTIKDYYEGIEMTPEVLNLLASVPDKEEDILNGLGIKKADEVGNAYQEALQYPSLNVRHIETAWKGPGLKTVIPEYVTAHIDVRLVAETDAEVQIQKIKDHIELQGFLLLDRDPTDQERLNHEKIVKFQSGKGVNAFRTDMQAPIGQLLIKAITENLGEEPVSIRTMGGTVPIIPAINALQIPAIIVPMVNMDNNQHNPNENLRIGNMVQGIKICLAILTMDL